MVLQQGIKFKKKKFDGCFFKVLGRSVKNDITQDKLQFLQLNHVTDF